MTKKDLIFELKKRCSFWLNNKTISKKHALECLLGILENEESQPSLPSDPDEAAEKYANRGISSNADPYKETIAYQADKDAFKAGAEWQEEQGESFESTAMVNARGDSFVDGYYLTEKIPEGTKVIVQIRKK